MRAPSILHFTRAQAVAGSPARAFVVLLLLAAGTFAQTSNTTDGTTPLSLAPGAPAGSYGLSGFDNVNFYSGNLNFNLPLVRVGGRGGAQVGSYLSIDSIRWTVNKTGGSDGTPDVAPCGSEELQCSHEAVNQRGYNFWGSADPDPNWWQGLKVGYGPGVMHARQQKYKGVHNNTQNYTFLTRLTFTASDGTEYELRDVKESGNPRYLLAGQDLSRGTVFVSADGTSATFVSDAEVFEKQGNVWMDDGLSLTYPTGYLMLADGTRYRIEQGLVRWLRDRNGNRVTFAHDANGRVTKVTDSLGREVNYAYDVVEPAPYGLCDRITFSGFGGAQRVVRVSKADLSAALRPDFTIKKYGGPAGLFPELTGSSTTDFTTQVATSVWLPDGARRYQLFYNSYAELARVVLPTGGVIEYDYTPGSGVGAQTLEIHRRVVARRVYGDAAALASGRPELSQTYHASHPSNSETLVVVEQRDGDGRLVERSRHHFRGSAVAYQPPSAFYPPWDSGKEDVTETLDVTTSAHASAAVLRRTENTWQPGTPLSQWATNPDAVGGPHVSQTLTTLGDTGQVSRQTFRYDLYNNRTDLWEYDYGGAYPSRHTHTDYLTTNNGVDYTSHAGAHLRGLASAQQLYSVDPSTGAETPAAKSETRYDEPAYPLVTYPGVTVPGWSDPGTTTRGNATSVRSYIEASVSVAPDQACPAGACVETHARYDQLGNVRHLWDARGKLSKLFYDDAFCNDGGARCGGGFTPNTFAFVTRAETPVPGNTAHGATAPLATTSVYDFYTGKTYSSTDQNNQTTSISYEDNEGDLDPLDRPLSVTRPDGGRTDFEYGDAEGNLYVRVLADLDHTRRTESKEYFDGLGRAYRKATYEGSVAAQPWLNADAAYDALGRIVRSSLPYRSAGGAAALTPAGWSGVKRSETNYDELGRVRTVTSWPDGAAVVTAYAGSRVLITDQAGKQRLSEVDALGRLKGVWEVTSDDSAKYPGVEAIPSSVTAGLTGAAHGYQTSYFYDALGNLRRVKQGTQQRFFTYDSLGRLLRAKNPEQGAFAPGGDFPALTDSTSGVNSSEWSMGYVYDANGNLTKRIDARGTLTTYAYDALNRNITVIYSPGGATAATPAVSRYYDNPAAGANGLGRLWKSEASQTAQTTVDKYDPVGRPKEQTQKFWATNDWGRAFTARLSYNLSGNITSQVYPSERRVDFQYDATGRLADNGGHPAFRGTLGDGVEKTYASQILYDELGGMSQERFGTQTPVYNKRFYNSRGQLSEIRVSTYSITSTDPSQRTNWNRGALINHYSDQSWAGSGTDNNGNLKKQDIYIPNDDAVSGYGLLSLFYDYDALNRVQRVREGKGGVDQWVQAYDYDRWGNRTINAGGTWLGPLPATPAPTPAPSDLVNEKQFDKTDLQNTNRLYAPGDIALGMSHRRMQYDEAGNLTRDDYTGGGARAYDAEGRVTSAEFVAGQTQTASYTYDADGRRVKRSLGAGGDVWQIYCGGPNLLAEYAPDSLPAWPQKEYGYRGGELLVTAEAPGRYNVALASNGATATAQNFTQDGVFPNLHFQPSYASDGRRYASPQGDRYWRTEHGLPSWLQIDFGAQRTIDEVDVYTLADHPAYLTQADPAATQTFTQYGVTAFEVQYWNGSSWAAVQGGSVTGNNLVWKRLTFPAVTTSKIRVVATSAPDGVARITEVEAWGAEPVRVNVALQSQGGQASASSTTPDTEFPGLTFPASSLNNGDHKGLGWEHGGGWRDGTNNAYPDWVQVDFSGQKTIDQVNVFTVQDALSSPSEPTESMTFSQYGVTAFEVQYWNGSNWVTIPGGSVSGNDKVWRKFIFAAVTTSKVRVMVSNALAGRSRLVEVEAWGTTVSTAADVRWLVADHLGTPRMVVDQAGSLAGVTRRDYFPFGEEIRASISGRTTGQGYGRHDRIRNRFTGKERDEETKQDYFLARYHSSPQGRFTSPDPLLSSGVIHDPQTWNRYTYTVNNPLKYTDPLGMYICNGNGDQCRSVAGGLRNLERARDRFKRGTDEYNKLDRAVRAYGAAGVDNGVTVNFAATPNNTPANTQVGIRLDPATTTNKLVSAANPTGQETVVTIDPAQNQDANDLAMNLAHEGSHVADGSDLIGALPTDLSSAGAATVLSGPINLTKYATESRAFEVMALVAQARGADSLTVGAGRHETWNSGWRETDRSRLRAQGIDAVLAVPRANGGLYGVTPTMQGPKLIE